MSDNQSDLVAVSDDGAMTGPAKDLVRSGVTVLATAVSNTAHAHGWWSDDDGNRIDRNMGEMIALMHSELSEALESHRNSEPALWYKHVEVNNDALPQGHQGMPVVEGRFGKPEGIASEFADVIIRILDTCHTLNIPLVDALLNKAEYNRHRPYRHGGKTC